MPTIVVRGLDESVKVRLTEQASAHGRSMEAEVRAILTSAARRPNIGIALLEIARRAGGSSELIVPERSDIARAADFG